VAAFTQDAYLNDWGREFHGTGPMNFELREGRIASLRIS
jgi:hypothetical protein